MEPVSRKRFFFMHSSLALVFQIISALIWPFLIIQYYNLHYWGSVVDYILFAQIFTLIVDWGSRRYLGRRSSFDYPAFKGYLGRSFISRIVVLIIIQAFIISSPFGWTASFALMLWVFSKWLTQAFEAHYVYLGKNRLLAFTDILAFITTGTYVVVFHRNMKPEAFIMALALGQVLKAIVQIMLQPGLKQVFNFGHFNKEYYLSAFPFFILVFANMLHYVTDRYFIYVHSDHETKATYTIYSTLLYFCVVMPTYILYPLLDRKNPAVSQKKRSTATWVWVSSLVIPPVWAVIAYTVSRQVYGLPLSEDLLFFGIAYGIISFICYPFYHKILIADKTLLLAAAHFLAGITNAVICYLLVPKQGMQGAFTGAAASQFVLLATIIVFYIQEKNAKKQKLEFA